MEWSMPETPHMLLGQLALNKGYVDVSSLQDCLLYQKQSVASGRSALLGEILLARGYLDCAGLESLLNTQQRMRAERGMAGSRGWDAEPSDDITLVDPNIAAVRLRTMERAARGDVTSGTAPGAQEQYSDAPKRLGEYVLDERLGKGGMGTVYLAHKDGEDRWVALKVLEHLGDASDEPVKRFLREATFLLTLHHPNIVRAFEVGTADGRHFLSMEYVQGEHLGSRIDRDRTLDERAGLVLMVQVAEALRYAEQRNIVHRDVKPLNVLIRQDGVVKLADLGLAVLAGREDLRLTAPGGMVGTPAYMSPEHIESRRDIDVRSDIYSLGSTFYHALCGRAPFTGQIVAVCQQHLHEPPPLPSEFRPGLLPETEAILLKCLEKDRNARYRSCAELIDAIDGVLSLFDDVAAGPAAGTAATRPTGTPAKGSDGASGQNGRASRRSETSVEKLFGFSDSSKGRGRGPN
jgi:serine/threonine protein kinase